MKLNKIAFITASLFASYSALGNEQPSAEQLVGQLYGGVHYSFFKADNDRKLYEADIASSLEDGDGFGLEFGYRLNVKNELRIKFTDLSIETQRSGYPDEDGTLTAIDLLHFPDAKNLYLVAGANRINLDKAEVAANAGIGYRYYFSNRFATYLEGKLHHEIDESHTDFSASIGLVYFFGENKAKPVQAIKPAPAPLVQVQEGPKDSDQDGVYDDKDQCPDTPITHLVDIHGCTLFTEKESTMELMVNFDNNSAKVNDQYLPEIQRAADFLSQYPELNLTIEGHTSVVGSEAYNQTLSLKRAQAVVDTLVKQFNVDASRLKAEGYGESRVLNDANNEAAHAQNRRIMATLNVKKKVAVEK